MIYRSNDEILVTLLKEAVEAEGCQLAELDFENLSIKVNGPDEAVGACARAVAEIFD